jgi:S1-C subfamily serine protease
MNAYGSQGNVNLFGATLIPAPRNELEKLGLRAGVKVEKLEKGKVRNAGIREGFIITYINNTPVASPNDVANEIKKATRSILVEGVYPDGNIYYYGIGI